MSLNRNQTIALWYSWLIFVIALFVLTGEEQIPAWLAITVSIITLSCLLVFSLGDGSAATGRTLLKAVAGPVILVALALGGIGVYNTFEYSANPEDVGLLEPSLEYGERISLSGRIRNSSDVEVEEVTIRIRLYSLRGDSLPEDEPSVDSIATSFEDLTRGVVQGSLVDSLSPSVRMHAKLVDGETITWEKCSYHQDCQGIPPKEVESFSLQEYTSMRFPSRWAWSYEVLSAQ